MGIGIPYGLTQENGLVLAKATNCHNDYERLYLAKIANLKPHAVFFKRHFKPENVEKAYKSEPVVCIFDSKEVVPNSPEHLKIHRSLWSEGLVDLYIIRSASSTDIFQARKPAKAKDGDPNQLTVAHLQLSEQVEKELQEEISVARLFGTGTFWEKQWADKEITNVENTGPYQHLLDYLLKARKLLLPKFDDNYFTVDKLLITSVLIKFLEEKKDPETNRHTLTGIYKKLETENLVSVINEGKLLNLLDLLGTEFNGAIFSQFNETERNFIETKSLKHLVDFLEAKIEVGTGQMFLWEQYSFEHLPPEVISAIYENFIQDESKRKHDGQTEKGVVYTPIHLVNLMVDEAMPLSNYDKLKHGRYKVLDPTCGSGIFLVSTYKRLLQWWTINRFHETGKIEFPNKDTAQKLLEDNIFGVDVKETAVLVSIFSLTTTLIDYLSPKEDWENFKFQDLKNKNVIKAESPEGFFKWAAEAKSRNEQFDLVIGYPPFNPETGKKKEEIVKKERLLELGVNQKIPRGNFALSFFEAAMQIAEHACMIIPSSIALYDKSAQAYRKHLFTKYTVTKVFDFTHLRETLFVKKGQKKKTGRTPIVALNVINTPSERNPIEHVVVKRNTASEKKLGFEIDHYDIHQVPFNRAIDPDKQFVWKTNLLGGGRLFQLIYRFSLFETLNEFLREKDNSKWHSNSGYKIGGNTPKIKADFIKRGKLIKSISENGQIEFAEQERTDQVEWFPNPDLYKPNLLVFKLKLGKNGLVSALITDSDTEYTYFNRDFFGIHCPISEKEELNRIHDFISKRNPSFFLVYVMVHSRNNMILHETAIRVSDLNVLPVIDNEKHLKLSNSEEHIIKDIVNVYKHLGKQITPKHDGYILHKSRETTANHRVYIRSMP